MKKSFIIPIIFFFLLFSFFSSDAQDKSKKMSPTSSSEQAVELYYRCIEAAENAEISKSFRLMDKALEEDPDFFMVHFQRALFNLYFKNRADFKLYAEKALASDTPLNKAEQLLKDALSRLKENPGANLTNTGKKLVEMYPDDKNAYYLLAIFQEFNNDYKGAADTYEKGAKNVSNPAPFYNFLGYAYMHNDKMKKAEKAFNKYIELIPHHPNPYDSKGDYYMKKDEYRKASDSYLQAFALNSEWVQSYRKAEKAKKMMNEKKNAVNTSPEIKGAWMLVELRMVSDSVLQYSIPGKVLGSHIKMWSDDYFTVVGNYQVKGKKERDNFVAGTYSLDGNRYMENIHYHSIKALIGANPKMIMELKGDTLIQTWPAGDNGKYNKKNYSMKKYVRLD